MTNPEENNFEEQWRQAFENASMKPSDKLWVNIEAELDENRRRRPLFFLLRPSYLMGGIAALLLMLWGGISIFNNSNDNNEKTIVASKVQPKKATQRTDSQKVIGESDPQNMVLKDENIATINDNAVEKSSDNYSIKNQIKSSNKVVKNENLIVQNQGSNSIIQIRNSNNNSTQITDNQPVIAKNIEENKNKIDANTLNGKSFEAYRNRFQIRQYLVFESPEIENESIDQNESKFWVGLQSGVSPFNPNLSLGNIQTSASAQANEFAKSANGNTGNTSTTTLPNSQRDNLIVGMPKNQVRSGLATNFGFATGYQLSKKWSLESGLRYFSGNSNLLSNTYSINESTGQVNAFFADYVANNSNVDAVVADAESYDNRYQYLMMPLQAAYQIPIRKNLNMSVLGGISTDIFLQNSVSSESNFVSESTVNKSVYRTLNLSGLGGVRANYMVNKHWQANLGFNYQQALFSGFRSDNFNMRYRFYGLQYGLNYRF